MVTIGNRLIEDKCLSDDNKTDFIELMRVLFSYVNPNERMYLKPMKLVKEHRYYCGFDSEYQLKSYGRNKLLSTQLSISGTTLYRFNNLTGLFNIQKAIDATGERYNTNQILNIVENKKVKNCLSFYVSLLDELRLLFNFHQYEKVFKLLDMESTFKYLSDNKLVTKGFDFNKNSIEYTIPLNFNSEWYTNVFNDNRCKDYSFSELIDDIKYHGKKQIDRNLETFISEASLDNNIYKNEKYDNPFKNTKYDGCHNFFNLVDECLSKTRNSLFLLSHFSIADLSMLSDYDTLKDKFDLIQGTNSTVTKGYYYKNMIVHLRDTMH